MEATINAFKFILNKHLDLIEVYDDVKTKILQKLKKRFFCVVCHSLAETLMRI